MADHTGGSGLSNKVELGLGARASAPDSASRNTSVLEPPRPRSESDMMTVRQGGMGQPVTRESVRPLTQPVLASPGESPVRESGAGGRRTALDINPEQLCRQGDGLLEQGDHKGAYLLYRQALEVGYPGAFCRVGYCTASGYGVDKDEKQAYAWYRRAAEEFELPEALYYVGYCLDSGIGVEKNEAEAIAFYLRGAMQGSVEAQKRLGFTLSQSRQENEAKVDPVSAQDGESVGSKSGDAPGKSAPASSFMAKVALVLAILACACATYAACLSRQVSSLPSTPESVAPSPAATSSAQPVTKTDAPSPAAAGAGQPATTINGASPAAAGAGQPATTTNGASSAATGNGQSETPTDVASPGVTGSAQSGSQANGASPGVGRSGQPGTPAGSPSPGATGSEEPVTPTDATLPGAAGTTTNAIKTIENGVGAGKD